MSQHQQLVLRVPELLAERIHNVIDSDNDELSIQIRPEEGKAECFEFILDDIIYPALLQNLPSLVETHKTVDMKIFYKSGDVGQILVVYIDEAAREKALKEQRTLDEVQYHPHGLAPPTQNIIKKKYSKTRDKQTYSVEKIQHVVEQLKAFDSKDKMRKEVIEEVLEFEDWMVDKAHPEGIKLKLEGERWWQTAGGLLFEHPNILNFNFVEEVVPSGAAVVVGGGVTQIEGEVEEEAESEEEEDEEWLKQIESDASLKATAEQGLPIEVEAAAPDSDDEEDDDAWLKEIEAANSK